MSFAKGTLWQTVMTTAERAIRNGALRSFPTELSFLDDGGVRFSVRILALLKDKEAARKQQDAAERSGRQANPFLPPERDLVVADVSDSHLAVLNKFSVVDRHLLIVTRHFEDQDTLLTLRDFEALWLCMAEYDSLGFYNGGREAGASQQHRHLQVVPIPLAPGGGPSVPIEPLLADLPAGGIGTVARFPFRHACVRLRSGIIERPRDAAIESFELYCGLLGRVGMAVPCGNDLTPQSLPYCLLLTREWMLVVPRSREFFEDISLNSLAFAGSFFVRDREQLGRLRSAGPFNALRQVAFPPERR